MSIALIFAGQGSQFTGMGKDFYDKYEAARQVFDSIEMDFDVKDVCFNGPKEILNDTAYTQSCILACSMAIYEVLKDTVEYLKNKNANIDTTTIETYNYYKNLLNK